jgi:hypothetical protein
VDIPISFSSVAIFAVFLKTNGFEAEIQRNRDQRWYDEGSGTGEG